MVFFLSIGLLIDLGFLWENIGLVLLLWLFIAVFKTALNTGVLRFMGEPWRRAFLSSLILAQIGEFSFVLGAVEIDRQVIDADIHGLIVAVTVISLVTSPLWLNSARRVHHRAAQHPATLGALLRLVYFREWRLTRRVSVALAALAVTGIEKAQALFERVSRRNTSRATAQVPQQEVLPPLPPPDSEPEPRKPDA